MYVKTIMKPTAKAFLALPTAVLLALSANALALANDFERIKAKVIEQGIGSGVSDNSIAGLLAHMDKDGSFSRIDYEDLSREGGFPHRRHLENLFHLARAYTNESSSYYMDDTVKDSVVRGLQYWVAHDFVGENWHDNQISTPSNLADLMLVIGDALPEHLVEQAQPMIRRATLERVPGVFYGARPGGDRIAIAAIMAKNFLFLNDRESFDEIIQIISGEIKFSTGARGMQHDFSFHHRHDRVNNTTSYGYGKYANTFGEWAYYVANTEYAFPIDRIHLLVDYYLDGICKQLVYGVYRDIGVYDRSITQQRTSRPRGTREIERLLRITDYRREELEDILKLRKGEEAPIRSFAKFFWQTEHFAFQRPHFYTSVRMHSTRNKNNEQPYNGPGIVIHHRSDGANHLSLDGHEYDGIWPVYDWQKIPGTTVMQKPEHHVAQRYGGQMPVQKRGLTDFVGGVDDGVYGAVAYDFKSPHDLLEAKKSWFFFDNEYVCLGAGIHSDPDLPAYTTVNQALLRGEVTVRHGERTVILPKGKRGMENVTWVHHDRVGYIFPDPTTVTLSNRAEQGRWSDISASRNAPDTVVTRDVFGLGFNHGNRPRNASYQYIVVPGVTPEELSATSANNRAIEILSNTSEIQAVKHHALEMCQVVFYEAGEVEIADGVWVAMDSPGMAMLAMNGARIKELTVSDPSRKLTSVTLTVSGIYASRGENFSARPAQSQDSTVLTIELPTHVYAGRPVTIRL